MSRSNRKKLYNKIIENVEIHDVAAEGKSVARHNDMVIFVKYGAPGDIVDIRIKKTRKRHMEGEIARFHKKSDQRDEPFCEHFGTCGGCKWQHLQYHEQLAQKQKQVKDSLQRIGKIDYPYELTDIKSSANTRYYRNKLEYTFSNARWLEKSEIESGEQITDMNALGFHIQGFYDKVLDINKCYLQPDPSNNIRLSVKKLTTEMGLDFHNFRKREGFLRNLIIRNNGKGDFMVILVVNKKDEENIELILNHIQQNFPHVVSLYYIINPKVNDSIADLEPVHFAGDQFLKEEMEGLTFEVGPKSFYQTNSRQAYELYRIARDFAGLSEKDIVYDLYTGTGTIASFVSKNVRKVIGIEYIEEAILSARKNAVKNGLDNLLFYCADMAKILTPDFFKEQGSPDVIITDPPRAGMHPTVINTLARSGAKKIIYVSCNPTTQARDIEMLKDNYRLSKSQPVDMFPHTHHVENVALLKKI